MEEDTKPLILAIVGPSGAGKTMLSEYLKCELGLPPIVSYTTRPMREGETDGVEHHFVDVSRMPSKDRMLAYTKFGGNHYWADLLDVPETGCSYTIDEKGLMMLWDTYGDRFDIKAVLIKRDPELITVPENRRKRDRCRVRIEEAAYSLILENNEGLEEFLSTACKKIKELLQG
jgi:guanylate kinase